MVNSFSSAESLQFYNDMRDSLDEGEMRRVRKGALGEDMTAPLQDAYVEVYLFRGYLSRKQFRTAEGLLLPGPTITIYGQSIVGLTRTQVVEGVNPWGPAFDSSWGSQAAGTITVPTEIQPQPENDEIRFLNDTKRYRLGQLVSASNSGSDIPDVMRFTLTPSRFN